MAAKKSTNLLKLFAFGQRGVHVDESPLHSAEGDLEQAQNVIQNVVGNLGGVTNRPGLVRFNASAAAGPILGGIGVPLPDERGERHLFIGFNGVTA